VNIETAKAVYGEIVREAREREVLDEEQRSALPVASLANGHSLGEVRVIERADHDYRVVWSPPELHVGQDPAIDEASANLAPVDITTMPKDEAVEQIFGFEDPRDR
jgi:hypothetical protein